MSLRVVLYAEGAGEDSGEETLWPQSGHPLREEHLGSAHILLRRAIAYRTQMPEAAVQFVAPLRVRGRRARGSDLTDTRIVRQLLAWPPSTLRPHPQLAVVLVDEDGVADRRRKLNDATCDPDLLRNVVAVAVREFESWLLADPGAVANVQGQPVPHVQDVESLAPGVAKAALTRIVDIAPSSSNLPGGRRTRLIRRDIAARSDLSLLAQLKSFGTLLHDLPAALA